MSLTFGPAAARLTVLGSGWNNSSINSGDGLTEDGKLMEDIAGDLGYDYGDNVDWDTIAGDQNWTEEIYTDASGALFLPGAIMMDVVDYYANLAKKDGDLLQYAVPANVAKTLYGGMVSQERQWDPADTERPHKYFPDVYYIQLSENRAVLFQEEAFWHRHVDGTNEGVNDISITIRSGSAMKVYWSTCSTHFDDNYLPAPYDSYPIQYVCWQCLWGSFEDKLISATENTVTAEQVENGEVFEKTTINGETYYKISEGGTP